MPNPLAGDFVSAAFWLPTIVEYEDTSQAAISPGSDWFSGTPGVNTTFVAPRTERVQIGVSAFGSPGAITAATELLVSFRLHEGSGSGGTQILAETLFARTARYDVFTTTSAWVGGSVAWSVAGNLTFGQQYWVEVRLRQLDAAGGAMNVRGRKLIVGTAL